MASVQRHRDRRPYWVRMLNLGARGLSALSLDPLPVAADKIIARAVRAAGTDRFGDDPFREPLEHIVHDVRTNPHVTPFGKLVVRHNLTRRLTNWLHTEAILASNPAIVATPIESPLFILGLPRTGTTFLHRLLAVDPAHRAPLSWEMERPDLTAAQNSRPDPRIARSLRDARVLERAAPGLRHIHEFGAELPDECIVLMANDLDGPLFPLCVTMPRYYEWLLDHDMTTTYARHKRQLQLLQTGQPTRRWVLKAPFHLHGLPWLMRIYPDARIVQTHRDPCRVIPSVASLTVTMRDAFEDRVVPAAVASAEVTHLGGWLDRAMAERARITADGDARMRFHDLHYRQLIRDPIAAVRGLYTAFGWHLSDDTEHRMRAFLAENRQHKFGKHHYSLDQFSLAEESVRARFADYCEHFGVEPEAPA